MVPRYESTRAVFGDVQRHQYMVGNLGIWGWSVLGLMDPLPNSVIHSSTWNHTTLYHHHGWMHPCTCMKSLSLLVLNAVY